MDNFDQIRMEEEEQSHCKHYYIVAERYSARISSTGGLLNDSRVFSNGICSVVIEEFDESTDKDAEQKAISFYDDLQHAWLNKLEIFEVNK